MAKNQSNYYKDEKHPWSKTKDTLLGCYLKPFFDKTYPFSQNGLVYVDGFAGEGRFGDGSFGSPIIAMQKLQSTASKKRYKFDVQFIFAESDGRRMNRLKNAVGDSRGNTRYIRPPMFCPTFEEAMERAQHVTLRSGTVPSTFFFYVDPFGVKYLKMDVLLQSPNPQHTEVLVNFNTVGFIRDACAALKIAANIPSDIEVCDEGFDDETPVQERVSRLTRCIGSEDWKGIVESRRNGESDFWDVEYRIGKLFCLNASKKYKYVTNMPIRDMSKRRLYGGEIKYRMIHMTNNADGCVIMNNNMLKRNNELQTGQQSLFQVGVDGRDVATDAVAAAMREAVESLPVGMNVKMGELAAYVISRCGVFETDNPLLRTYLGPYLENGIIERVVKTTDAGRAKSSFNLKDRVYRPTDVTM